MRAVWIPILFLALSTPAAPPAIEADPTPAPVLSAVSVDRMLADLVRLTEFNGRQTATDDDVQSARYVAERFTALGLQPAGTDRFPDTPESWLMTAPARAITISNGAIMTFEADGRSIAVRLGEDYLPVLDSPSVALTAPVIFVGYGVSDPAGRDDYAGIDARNTVVMFLRGQPEGYAGSAAHAEKVRTARAHGAVGYLMLTPPILSAYEARRGTGQAPLAYYGASGQTPHDALTLPGAWISTALGEQLLQSADRSLRRLQEEVNRTRAAQSLALPVRVQMRWDSVPHAGTLANVVGLIPPSRDGTAQPSAVHEQYVVLGAHRDHFGRQAGLLFPGADDNASGTAILLETARVLTLPGVKRMRAVLVVSFSGEEQGMLGSRAYVARPARPLPATHAMLNVDHAGVGNGRLTVGVTDLPKSVVHDAASAVQLGTQVDVFGFFPGGDHVPFHMAGIRTVTVVSGGPHPHVHRPSDSAETIQPDVLVAAARFFAAAAWRLTNE